MTGTYGCTYLKKMSKYRKAFCSGGISSGGMRTVRSAPDGVGRLRTYSSNSSSGGASAKAFLWCEMYGAVSRTRRQPPGRALWTAWVDEGRRWRRTKPYQHRSRRPGAHSTHLSSGRPSTGLRSARSQVSRPGRQRERVESSRRPRTFETERQTYRQTDLVRRRATPDRVHRERCCDR